MNGKTFQGRVLRVNMATGATRGAGRGPHMLPQTAVAGGGVVVGGDAGAGGGAFVSQPQFAGAAQALPLPAGAPAAGGGGGGSRQPEMAPEQLWQALQDIRAQAAQNPERVAGLLMANQQLALAVAGALAVFGVLASNTPQLIIDARQAQAQAFQQQQQQQQQQNQAFVAVPVAVGMQQQQQPQGQGGGQEGLSAEAMEAMVEQLKHLTDEQVRELSPELRDMVLQLHQSLMFCSLFVVFVDDEE